MSRRGQWWWSGIVLSLLGGCADSSLSRMQYPHTRPPRVAREAPVDAREVSFRIALDRELTDLQSYPREAGSLETPDDFRVALGGAPAQQPAAGERVLGDLRTADRLFDLAGYHAVRCGYAMGVSRSQIESRALEILLSGLSVVDFELIECADLSAAQARFVAAPVLSDVVDEMRSRAASVGADVVDEFRCFARADLLRVWCEGKAVRTTNAGRRTFVQPSLPTLRVRASRPQNSTTSQLVASTVREPAVDTARDEQLSVMLRVEDASSDPRCARAEAVRDGVRTALGRDPFVEDGTMVASVRWVARASRWDAIVQFRRGETVLSTRTIRGRSNACDDLVASVVLSLSLAFGRQ